MGGMWSDYLVSSTASIIQQVIPTHNHMLFGAKIILWLRMERLLKWKMILKFIFTMFLHVDYSVETWGGGVLGGGHFARTVVSASFFNYMSTCICVQLWIFSNLV